MRHGRTFRKRFLTFLLSLAMVLTSVNVPMLTVWAEEVTPGEDGNDNGGTQTLPGGSDDASAPSDSGGGGV